MHTPRCAAIAILVATLAAVPCAQGQVYKCTDAEGRTTYSDAPCSAKAKPLNLQDPSAKSATDPNMCAQLLDELNRLDAEAQRSLARGRTPSASSEKRRQGLTRQYEARCAGVSRATPR